MFTLPFSVVESFSLDRCYKILSVNDPKFTNETFHSSGKQFINSAQAIWQASFIFTPVAMIFLAFVAIKSDLSLPI